MSIRSTAVLLTGAVALTVAGAHAQAPSPALAARIDAMATELLPAAVAVRRDLHQHPELGFHETRTAGIPSSARRRTARSRTPVSIRFRLRRRS
jgi:hypothetical protein